MTQLRFTLFDNLFDTRTFNPNYHSYDLSSIINPCTNGGYSICMLRVFVVTWVLGGGVGSVGTMV